MKFDLDMGRFIPAFMVLVGTNLEFVDYEGQDQLCVIGTDLVFTKEGTDYLDARGKKVNLLPCRQVGAVVFGDSLDPSQWCKDSEGGKQKVIEYDDYAEIWTI